MEKNKENSKTLNLPTTRYDLQILQSLRRIIRAIDIYSRKLKSTYQLTVPQLICLLKIVEDGPLNTTALSRAVYLNPSTIVGILDRLESRNLIIRNRDVVDRRIVNVSATKEGKILASEAPSPLQDNFAQALLQLPELEQATIALSLKRIVDLMEVDKLDASPLLETSDLNSNIKKGERL